jgi:hypothetical protein
MHRIDTLENCCPEYLIIDDEEYTVNTKLAVNNYIHSGLSDDVLVKNGVSVEYNAGNDIKLGNFFKVESGGNFKAILRPCESVDSTLNKRQATKNQWQRPEPEPVDSLIVNKVLNRKSVFQDDPYLALKPNPSYSRIDVKYTESEFEYEIIDSRGEIVQKGYSNQSSTTLNISMLRKGLYYLKVKNHVSKFIKF